MIARMAYEGGIKTLELGLKLRLAKDRLKELNHGDVGIVDDLAQAIVDDGPFIDLKGQQQRNPNADDARRHLGNRQGDRGFGDFSQLLPLI
jgi:hypothetical protein